MHTTHKATICTVGASHADPRSSPQTTEKWLQNFHQPRRWKGSGDYSPPVFNLHGVEGLAPHIICPTICTPAQMNQNIRKNTSDNASIQKGN